MGCQSDLEAANCRTRHSFACRGAADVAFFLSQARLSDLAPNTTSASQLPSTHASLARAVLACRVAQLLLRCTALAVQEESQLEPALVFRLASCVSVAHGPAAEAAQLVYKFAAAAGLSEQQKTTTARLLTYAYQHIFEAAASAVSLVRKLDGREPAAALRATLCRPQKASPLYHLCGGALEWCAQQQGASARLGSQCCFAAR